MKATIETVLEAVSRETGREFKRYERDKYMTKCVGHDDGRTAAMSVDRRSNVVRCFGPCSRPDGNSGAGVLQVPLLFGFAKTQAEAIEWLVQRKLIDEKPPDRGARVFRPERRRYPTDPKHLLLDARAFRRQTYVDLCTWFDKRTIRRIQGLLDVGNSRYVEATLGERALAYYELIAQEADATPDDLVAAHMRVHRLAPSLLRHAEDPACSCHGFPDPT